MHGWWTHIGELVGLHYLLFLFPLIYRPMANGLRFGDLADFGRPEVSFTCRNLPGLAYARLHGNRRLRCVMNMNKFQMPREMCLKYEPYDPYVFLWTSNPSKLARSALRRILGRTWPFQDSDIISYSSINHHTRLPDPLITRTSDQTFLYPYLLYHMSIPWSTPLHSQSRAPHWYTTVFCVRSLESAPISSTGHTTIHHPAVISHNSIHTTTYSRHLISQFRSPSSHL